MFFQTLKGKIVFVTGTYQGIGQSIATLFLAEGCIVIGADLAYENPDLTAVKESFYTVKLDLADQQNILRVSCAVSEKIGVPDIVVNCAGISTIDFVIESQVEDWEKVFSVNSTAVYLLSKEFAKQMVVAKKSGRIIQIASQAGKNGYRGMASYCASKHAVLGLTKVMALELAQNDILVNAVCPGIVETPMKARERIEGGLIRGMSAQEVYEEDCSQIPLGRTAKPEEVAQVVLFLASPLASYMTGQALNVTGGMTMN